MKNLISSQVEWRNFPISLPFYPYNKHHVLKTFIFTIIGCVFSYFPCIRRQIRGHLEELSMV